MIDDFAKEYLHGDLQEAREAVLWKLDRDALFWAEHCLVVEQAAQVASSRFD